MSDSVSRIDGSFNLERVRSVVLLFMKPLNFGVSVVMTMPTAAAFLLLMFFMCTVTPTTTLYQFSQITHHQGFWVITFLIALMYQAIVWGFSLGRR